MEPRVASHRLVIGKEVKRNATSKSGRPLAWQVGQRLSRKGSAERGTVTEQDGEIKVIWDDGRTSYQRSQRTTRENR